MSENEEKSLKTTKELDNDVLAVFDALKNLSIERVASLVSALEEEFGVSAQSFSAGGAVSNAEASEDSGPSSFDVLITDAGESKIKVIKEVRAITGLGLVEAKNLVSSGGVVKSGLSKEESAEVEKKLKECGASVDVKPSQ